MTRTKSILACGVSAWCLALVPCASEASVGAPRPIASRQATVSYNIPAGALGPALSAYARQSGREILFASDLVAGRRTGGVSGAHESVAALRLLLEGTGLEIANTAGAVITLRVQTQRSELEGARPGDPSTQLEEVVVTGSNIRGAAPVGSPVVVLTQEDIGRRGLATVAQAIESLPQNFAGDVSAGNFEAFGGSAALNFARTSSPNLRGLGSTSTLTLLNGRRLPAANMGSGVDLNLIPVAAVQRIDVLLDGASAVYGADAVGGVVNVILRDDFQGAETAVRLAGTRAGGEQRRVSQVVGGAWAGGGAILTYEHFEQEPIYAADRSYAESPGPQALLPGEDRDSIFATLRHRLGRFSLATDLYASRRETDFTYYDTVTLEGVRDPSESVQYGANLGLIYDLNAEWSIAGNVAAGWNAQDQPPIEGFGPSFQDGESSAVDVTLNGEVIETAGGVWRIAIGGGARWEAMVSGYAAADSRTASFAFGELNMPLVSEANARPGLHSLSAVAAVRYDDTTYGEVWTPKFGVEYAPVEGITLRGAYGQSFRAPTLYDTNTFNRQIFILPLANAAGGTTRTVIVAGNSADLDPERADSYSLGAVYRPTALPGLRIEVGGYDIRYEDRILVPPLGLNALTNPAAAPFVTLRSTAGPAIDALIAEILATPTRSVFGCVDFRDGLCRDDQSTINAVYDVRKTNFAETAMQGIDYAGSYTTELLGGIVTAGLSGTWIAKLEQKAGPDSPPQRFVDVALYQASRRMRGSLSYASGPWRGSVSANHVGGYDVSTVPGSGQIDAWTTYDLHGEADLGALHSSLDGVRLSVAVNNVLDEDPPYFGGTFYQLGYDPTNASPIGRFIAVDLRKSW